MAIQDALTADEAQRLADDMEALRDSEPGTALSSGVVLEEGGTMQLREAARRAAQDARAEADQAKEASQEQRTAVYYDFAETADGRVEKAAPKRSIWGTRLANLLGNVSVVNHVLQRNGGSGSPPFANAVTQQPNQRFFQEATLRHEGNGGLVLCYDPATQAHLRTYVSQTTNLQISYFDGSTNSVLAQTSIGDTRGQDVLVRTEYDPETGDILLDFGGTELTANRVINAGGPLLSGVEFPEGVEALDYRLSLPSLVTRQDVPSTLAQVTTQSEAVEVSGKSAIAVSGEWEDGEGAPRAAVRDDFAALAAGDDIAGHVPATWPYEGGGWGELEGGFIGASGGGIEPVGSNGNRIRLNGMAETDYAAVDYVHTASGAPTAVVAVSLENADGERYRLLQDGPDLKLFHVTSGGAHTSLAQISATQTPQSSHTLALERRGERLVAYRDGVALMDLVPSTEIGAAIAVNVEVTSSNDARITRVTADDPTLIGSGGGAVSAQPGADGKDAYALRQIAEREALWRPKAQVVPDPTTGNEPREAFSQPNFAFAEWIRVSDLEHIDTSGWVDVNGVDRSSVKFFMLRSTDHASGGGGGIGILVSNDPAGGEVVRLAGVGNVDDGQGGRYMPPWNDTSSGSSFETPMLLTYDDALGRYVVVGHADGTTLSFSGPGQDLIHLSTLNFVDDWQQLGDENNPENGYFERVTGWEGTMPGIPDDRHPGYPQPLGEWDGRTYFEARAGGNNKFTSILSTGDAGRTYRLETLLHNEPQIGGANTYDYTDLPPNGTSGDGTGNTPAKYQIADLRLDLTRSWTFQRGGTWYTLTLAADASGSTQPRYAKVVLLRRTDRFSQVKGPAVEILDYDRLVDNGDGQYGYDSAAPEPWRNSNIRSLTGYIADDGTPYLMLATAPAWITEGHSMTGLVFELTEAGGQATLVAQLPGTELAAGGTLLPAAPADAFQVQQADPADASLGDFTATRGLLRTSTPVPGVLRLESDPTDSTMDVQGPPVDLAKAREVRFVLDGAATRYGNLNFQIGFRAEDESAGFLFVKHRNEDSVEQIRLASFPQHQNAGTSDLYQLTEKAPFQLVAEENFATPKRFEIVWDLERGAILAYNMDGLAWAKSYARLPVDTPAVGVVRAWVRVQGFNPSVGDFRDFWLDLAHLRCEVS